MARNLPQGWDHGVFREIVSAAIANNLDPAAVIAVALGEGGVRYGAVGDNNTSFGPFQLHVGGALPEGKDAAWANSPEGIRYAIRSIIKAGAAGKRGNAAINTIIRRFERPANPDASVTNAIERYSGLTWINKNGVPTPVAGPSTPVSSLRTLAAQYRSVNPIQAGELPSQALVRMLNERQQMQSLLASNAPPPVETVGGTPKPFSLPNGIVAPLGGAIPTKSEFNVQDPEGSPGKGGRYHSALDWFNPAGSPVYSPWGGRVVEVTPSRGNSGQVFGGVVKIQAPNGLVFVTRHVDPRNIEVGQTVNAGTVLAGVTDWKGGSDHAHIEIWRSLKGGYNHGNMIDPVTVFRASKR